MPSLGALIKLGAGIAISGFALFELSKYYPVISGLRDLVNLAQGKPSQDYQDFVAKARADLQKSTNEFEAQGRADDLRIEDAKKKIAEVLKRNEAIIDSAPPELVASVTEQADTGGVTSRPKEGPVIPAELTNEEYAQRYRAYKAAQASNTNKPS